MTEHHTIEVFADPLLADAIAVVGMAGRFPGAANVNEFWRNLCAGVTSVRRLEESELEDAFSDQARRDPTFVRARPVLDDVDLFDADFFSMHPREAALTDPQQRVFLECAWEALEDAAYDPGRYSGAIGVFAGCSMNTYFLKHVCADRLAVEQYVSEFQVGCYAQLLGALQDFLTTRVSHKLGLRGPSITVGTACSTSLTAIAQACQSLLLHQSDMALAGGVSISFPQKRGYQYQEGGIVSPDGCCRPFDVQAAGTVFGSGCAIVALKRLEDAVASRDHIYCVVRGHGINNDGSEKIGFAAPSARGQADAIAQAHAMAGVDADSIGYVECHGTATPLGDPIEFSGLMQAFASAETRRAICALGSVKANVGHLDAAAGVTGFIKAALALHHRKLLPQIHFTKPNPHIDLENSPFFVNTELRAWAGGVLPRRAGVSAFGVGGTNVHVVLEEAPTIADPVVQMSAAPIILPLSARTATALQATRESLAGFLQNDSQSRFLDVAHTLQVGRRAFTHRQALVCRDRNEALAKLRTSGAHVVTDGQTVPTIVFMFPGQGSQYPGMARALYRNAPVFREIVDRGSTILEPLAGRPLAELFQDDDASDPDSIRSTSLAQPLLFLVEYGLARLWMCYGVEPSAMVGHSVGEFVAACLADVLSFEDALRVIAARGRLMESLPGGAMLAVRLSEDALRPLLGKDLVIAAVNAARTCVASGPTTSIMQLESRLAEANIASQRLHTSHAFHSDMMMPIVPHLESEVSRVTLRPPSRPYVSCVTGTWATSEQATSPSYWARHCLEPVRFAQGLETIVAQATPQVLLEVGPGRTLSTLAAQSVRRNSGCVAISSLPEAALRDREEQVFADAVARVWELGASVMWEETRGRATAKRISLPTYPFERKRHWVEDPNHGALKTPISFAEPLPVSTTGTDSLRLPVEQNAAPELIPDQGTTSMTPRKERLENEIFALLEELFGDALSRDTNATFIEFGFNSLFLGQVAQRLQKVYGIKLSFRQLLRDVPSVSALADYLIAMLPPEPVAVTTSVPVKALPAPAETQRSAAPSAGGAAPIVPSGESAIENIMREQLQTMQRLMSEQLQALSLSTASSVPAPSAIGPAAIKQTAAESPVQGKSAAPSRFDLYRPKRLEGDEELTPRQVAFIADLVSRYTARTAGSKAATQQHRRHLADPRAASGFDVKWKELVYPVVCVRSKGAKIWDVDGNEYVDLVNGYGQTAFGHAPVFVTEALTRQLQDGFAIGPQTPLAGEVAGLICEMTGSERVTFCNTGSEAVMAALRLARTVTGRTKVAVFGGAYHGQFDEVLIRGGSASGAPRALPIAPGIPTQSVSNMVVLPYATDESLAWVRANADSLAAVVAEVVQSRHPNLRPKEFLTELRSITAQSGAALVFDEVVTGFRVHPAGMQGLFGLKADLTTYGKVLGGGMPIGVLAGSSRFMDALDGGHWQYGDASVPETAPTFFAGTFVRHPLALAAARAVLLHLKQHGPALQEGLAVRTADLIGRINADLQRRGLQTRAETFSSWFYIDFAAEDRLASLFYTHMRLCGVHIHEGFPCFITTAHTDADMDRIADAFKTSLDALQAAGILSGSSVSAAGNAAVVALPEGIAMTEQQSEIWMLAQLGDEASCCFNESLTLRLMGELSVPALLGAIKDVVQRHDALRARFGKAGQSMQVVPELNIEVQQADLRGDADANGMLLQAIAADAALPFDLANGPLVRAQLLRVAHREYSLLLTAHHIICDGWSMNVIIDELAACYATRCAGSAAQLSSAMQFRRYALDKATPDPGRATTEAYWLGQYRVLPETAELPTDRPRPAGRNFRGSTFSDRIDLQLYRALKKTSAQNGCTLFATLFAALQVLLGRLANSKDVVLAIPTAGQSAIDGEVLVGHCVNFLPVRAAFDPKMAFAQHLTAVKTQLFDAYEHSNYTFGTLVQKLGVKRASNRLPITDIQFNLENLGSGLTFSGLEATVRPNAKAFVNFDLFFNMIEGDDGIRIDVDYRTDLYDESTIARWTSHLRVLLEGIVAEVSCPIAQLPLLSKADKTWLLDELNPPRTAYRSNCFVHELVAEQATRAPHAVAATFDGTSITYATLDARANQLARHLQRVAEGASSRIAVASDRSIDMLVALLAVLKAGYAYVPLDPTHPRARLSQTLSDADVAAIVCTNDTMAAIAPGHLPIVRQDLEQEKLAGYSSDPLPLDHIDPAQAPAYVIFTSGSTGAPKGVEVSHRAFVNLLSSMADRPGLSKDDILVAVTTISFDIAGLELFLPLMVGARVVIASPEAVQDGFALVRLLESSKATVLQATPTLWRILLEAGLKPRPVLKMICGGEPLPRDLADSLLKAGGELWNVYGPTETTIWSSTGRVAPGVGPITIGKPIANTGFYILSEEDAMVPVGVAGELYIGGDGLARGYFNRLEQTKAAFRDVSLDGRPAQRVYRTGDVARRLPDGSILLLGRRDHQVKLRGFRIELEDIEVALRKHAVVAACAVVLRTVGDGDPRLVGYVVAVQGMSLDTADLARHLGSLLPVYMVPTLWVEMHQLPQTDNGKLDRKALPAPVPSAAKPALPLLPRTPREQQLAEIWRDVLGIDEIGVDDKLISLGADSLHIFRIAARMVDQGLGLEAKHLLLHPTIAELALAADEGSEPRGKHPSLKEFRRGARRAGRTH